MHSVATSSSMLLWSFYVNSTFSNRVHVLGKSNKEVYVWDWTTSSVLVHVNPFGVAYIEDITWPGGDTNFIASLTRERYFQHSKIKFVAPSGHIMFCLFYRYWWNSYIKDNLFFIPFRNSKIVQLKWSPIAKCLSQKCYEAQKKYRYENLAGHRESHQ